MSLWNPVNWFAAAEDDGKPAPTPPPEPATTKGADSQDPGTTPAVPRPPSSSSRRSSGRRRRRPTLEHPTLSSLEAEFEEKRRELKEEYEGAKARYLKAKPPAPTDLPTYLGNATAERPEVYWENTDLDLIVIPSLSVDAEELQKVLGVHHYEERMLFNLVLLKRPKARVLYITSQPVDPAVVDYYLSLVPNHDGDSLKQRLTLLSTHDASARPLIEKILERPLLVDAMKKFITRPDRAVLSCFTSTKGEFDLAAELGIPLLASPPEAAYWGSKSGSRTIFKDAGIPLSPGLERCTSPEMLTEELAKFWEQHSDVKRIVVKLDESFSGEGNAILDLRKTPMPETHEERVTVLQERLAAMEFAGTGENWEHYQAMINKLGVIAEIFIEGDIKYSPSVQCCVASDGHVEILSTHEQILGGPNKQVYLGCRFPADNPYRTIIQKYGRAVGEQLHKHGCKGNYGVDFLVTPLEYDEEGKPKGDWDVTTLEINLRMGGTTHPLMALKLLTGGQLDESTGLFMAGDGDERKPKYYLATDNLRKEEYKGLLPRQLMRIMDKAGVGFDHTTKTGVKFHLFGTLSEFGKVGMTCIADSPEQAQVLYDAAEKALDEGVAKRHRQKKK